MAARDVALCAVIVGGAGGCYWLLQSWAFHVPPPTRLEAPPATNPPYPIRVYESESLEPLRNILPDGPPAPPPPGVTPAELETRAA